jgi:AcrR family transcriptional regulator
MAAVLDLVRERGVSAASARAIAARAEVNQALVFYHFGSVDNLLAQACRTETAARLATYRDQLAAVGSMRELLDVGRELNARERTEGNVAVLAQLLAASAGNEVLRSATGYAFGLWTSEVEAVLRRVLGASALDGLLDPAALAHLVSAAFIGLELFGTVDQEAADAAMTELDRLGLIAEAIDNLGPVARRAARAKLGRAKLGRAKLGRAARADGRGENVTATPT